MSNTLPSALTGLCVLFGWACAAPQAPTAAVSPSTLATALPTGTSLFVLPAGCGVPATLWHTIVDSEESFRGMLGCGQPSGVDFSRERLVLLATDERGRPIAVLRREGQAMIVDFTGNKSGTGCQGVQTVPAHHMLLRVDTLLVQERWPQLPAAHELCQEP